MYIRWLFLLILLLANHIQSLAQSKRDSLEFLLNKSVEIEETKNLNFLLGEHLVQLDPERSEKYAVTLSNMANTPKDSLEWTRLNYIFAASNRWKGNYKTALSYYSLNYSYFKNVKDSLQIAECAQKIGSINTFLGNNTVAQSYLLETASIYDMVGTERQKASINNSLAGLYLNLDQLEKGKEWYLKGLEAFTLINDSIGMANTNCNLGYVFTELGNFELAEKHLLAQRQLKDVYPTQREMGFHYDFIGILRRKQGRLQEAYQAHLKALSIRKTLSSTYNLCESKLNVSDMLIRLGHHNKAIEHLKDVLSFEEHNSLNQSLEAYRLLSIASENLGEYSQALTFHKLYKEINDSIYNKNSLDIIAEKDARFQKKENENQISLLNQENRLKEAELNQSKLIIYGGLIGLLVFVVLIVFILIQYRKIKGKNSLISNSLSEKELLLREIHHRVKNNLQVISSLLSLQSRYIVDDEAKNAVSEGQNRVKSMALIHQKLYQHGNITGVEALDYIQNLTNTLKSTYGIDNEQIAIDFEVDQLNIDVDTIIPLGLILNELISNSFKHAFPDERKGALSIKLKKVSDNLLLSVSDNGIGTNKEINQTNSFGMRMIHSLARKLEATVDFNFKEGTSAVLNISSYKLV